MCFVFNTYDQQLLNQTQTLASTKEEMNLLQQHQRTDFASDTAGS